MSAPRMKLGGIAVLVILGAVFVAVSSIGIGRYNKCSEIQGDANNDYHTCDYRGHAHS
jgi:hypothetical protein